MIVWDLGFLVCRRTLGERGEKCCAPASPDYLTRAERGCHRGGAEGRDVTSGLGDGDGVAAPGQVSFHMSCSKGLEARSRLSSVGSWSTADTARLLDWVERQWLTRGNHVQSSGRTVSSKYMESYRKDGFRLPWRWKYFMSQPKGFTMMVRYTRPERVNHV